MFSLGTIILLFSLFLIEEIISLKLFIKRQERKKISLLEIQKKLQEEGRDLSKNVSELERKISDIFSFYDFTRKLAPILYRKELLDVFFDNIRRWGNIEQVDIISEEGKSLLSPGEEGSSLSKDNSCLKFDLGEYQGTLYLKTNSEKISQYFPHFSKLLSLCLERITLYERMQEMSIHDSLTEVYNRRYFMVRYMEEFNRAKKFHLNLSFLMIDIDNFKKINDTFGHLVGDVVLREVAKHIKDNIREIDFVARYGGEEFSVILPDTDKAGAIMVGERIRTEIASEKIRAFDEILSVSISIGLATFPKNTLHSDVLIEIADKALYKAKTSGKDRVCWF